MGGQVVGGGVGSRKADRGGVGHGGIGDDGEGFARDVLVVSDGVGSSGGGGSGLSHGGAMDDEEDCARGFDVDGASARGGDGNDCEDETTCLGCVRRGANVPAPQVVPFYPVVFWECCE